MSNSNPPRFLPTLTEVVSPEVLVDDAQDPATLHLEDTAQITQAVLAKITPLLEQKLRSSAQELFEVQVNVVLPELHRQVEAAVQQAIQETLAERSAHANQLKP